MHTNAQDPTATAAFKPGDFVLFRDPNLFWSGKPNHTFVCRITRSWTNNTHDLLPLVSGLPIHEARPEYMRLLPPLDAMRDIDSAPLNTDGAADDMTAAAIAWLTQQHATANKRPELPAQRD
ncbi:hypothetical protein BGK72_38890 [Streptomyces agglomeratus]|nr:hypothetical protein BGK72_38890 [Streptomyces agglomeratus]